MILKITLFACIALGILILSKSLIPATKICRMDNSFGWKTLVILIFLFIFGYLFLLVKIVLASLIGSTLIVFSAVLLGGSIFVALVLSFSLDTILKIRKIAQEDRYRALHDSLTELPNRKHLFRSLDSRSDDEFTLFLIDLNNFKQINDGLGHYMGDRFLVAVSKRIQKKIPDDVKMFRLGGDEFAIIVDSVIDEALLSLVDDIHDSLIKPVEIATYAMNTSASIGMAKYPQDIKEGQDTLSLLNQADLAMYDAKKNTKKYMFYNDALGQASYEKLQLSQRLGDAIENDEFELYYQPIFDAKNNVILAFEALLRWPQSDGSFIMPDSFIPLAEKSALINLISVWVINAATRDLCLFKEKGIMNPIHINLSAKDIQTDTVTIILQRLVKEEKIQSGDFAFEITERDMVEDIDKAKAVMKSINQLGFSFSVDDFGTGFSSLVILRDLPIDEIKIDRSFVQDFDKNETNLLIICHVLSLAQDLNCSVVAEGVETENIKNNLLKLGAIRHQGYYYSRPMNLKQIIQSYAH